MSSKGIPIESMDERSWKLADLYVDFYGAFSSLFTSAIGSIVRTFDGVENADEFKLSGYAWESVYFLVHTSPTLKAIFYKAAEMYHPDTLAQIDKIRLTKVLGLFSASEISAIVTLSYLYRRTRKLVHEGEWKILAPKFQQHSRIGGVIGSTLRSVGIGNGTLMAGARYLAISLLSKKNMKSFKEYRRVCAKNHLLFDLEGEVAAFGCNHLQIASRLIAKMGYYNPFSPISTCLGLMATNSDFDDLEGDDIEKLLSWRVILDWTAELHSKGEILTRFDEGHDLYISEDQEEELVAQTANIIDVESPLEWLDATEKDIDPEVFQLLSRQKKISIESMEAELE